MLQEQIEKKDFLSEMCASSFCWLNCFTNLKRNKCKSSKSWYWMQVNSSVMRSAGKLLWKKRISPEAGRRKVFRKVNGILIWELEKGKKFYSLVNNLRINCIAKDSKLFLKAVSIQFSVVPSFPKENNSME